MACRPSCWLARVVIDTCNYYPQRDGHIAELDHKALTSSELIQRHLAGARLVKAFNNIFFRHLASLSRPAGAADRSFLPNAGDEGTAKAQAARFWTPSATARWRAGRRQRAGGRSRARRSTGRRTGHLATPQVPRLARRR